MNQKFFEDFLRKPSITQACKTLNMAVAASFDSLKSCIDLNRERRMRNSKYILNKP